MQIYKALKYTVLPSIVLAASAAFADTWDCTEEITERSATLFGDSCWGRDDDRNWACIVTSTETCRDRDTGRTTTRHVTRETGQCSADQSSCW